MFLTKLYRHSRPLFVALVLFLCAFAFLNVKWGATATPIYQYGMFSGVMHRADTQRIFQLYEGSELINLSRYPFAQRDKLLVALKQYEFQNKKNDAAFATMQRLLSNIGLGRLMKKAVYTNQLTDLEFHAWYNNMLLQNTPGDYSENLKISVYPRKYIWQAGSLQPADSSTKIDLFAY